MTTATISQGTPDPRAHDQLEALASHPTTPATPPVLDVVVPVFNEEAQLELTMRRLDEHLRRHFPYSYRITVADNASTDNTGVIARRITRQLPNVRPVRLEQKGRGRGTVPGVERVRRRRPRLHGRRPLHRPRRTPTPSQRLEIQPGKRRKLLAF